MRAGGSFRAATTLSEARTRHGMLEATRGMLPGGAVIVLELREGRMVMRALIISCNVTVDGFMSGPDKSLDFIVSDRDHDVRSISFLCSLPDTS